MKRRRRSDSASGEDTDDDDYVPYRRSSARRRHKHGSSSDDTRGGEHSRPRRAKRRRVKAEGAEDLDLAEDADDEYDDSKPFGLDIVKCQWQGCGETVKRLHIWHHIEKRHLARPGDELGEEKRCTIECLWAGDCRKTKPHAMQRDSLRQHIHSTIGTAYLCRCFCWTTEAQIEERAQKLRDKRAGRVSTKQQKPATGDKEVWGPCLRLYSQVWRLNKHIASSHKGECETTSKIAMLLD